MDLSTLKDALTPAQYAALNAAAAASVAQAIGAGKDAEAQIETLLAGYTPNIVAYQAAAAAGDAPSADALKSLYAQLTAQIATQGIILEGAAEQAAATALQAAFTAMIGLLGRVAIAAATRMTQPAPNILNGATAIVLGGLGESQMTDIALALSRVGVTVNQGQEPGETRVPDSGYLVDVPAMYALLGRPPRLILIGHSMAAKTVCEASKVIPCDLLVMIDPAGTGDFDFMQDRYLSPRKTLWIKRSAFIDWSFTVPATVKNCPVAPVFIRAGHNQLPHDPGVIQMIVAAITGENTNVIR